MSDIKSRHNWETEDMKKKIKKNFFSNSTLKGNALDLAIKQKNNIIWNNMTPYKKNEFKKDSNSIKNNTFVKKYDDDEHEEDDDEHEEDDDEQSGNEEDDDEQSGNEEDDDEDTIIIKNKDKLIKNITNNLIKMKSNNSNNSNDVLFKKIVTRLNNRNESIKKKMNLMNLKSL